jgi:hypothetical protein
MFLLQAMLPPDPPAVTAPAPCPTPPEYTYSDWQMTREERQFQGEWVVQYLHYSRTMTDECRGTSSTQSKVEGPYRLWEAVPANRVSDVNHPEGPTDSLSGSPLRSSTLPDRGAPGAVGPNPQVITNTTSGVPVNKPSSPAPFFPGFALFAGVLVASLFLRRRTSKQDTVAENEVEPLQGPPLPPATARTLDSIRKGEEWVPNEAEVKWLQAFFGIEEEGYGPLTKAAVKKLQEKYNIPPDSQVKIGPNTYRALWQEHLNLVHETWKKRAAGQSPSDLDQVLASPLPSDLKDETTKLNDAYAAYWAAIEGRYQAILRRDSMLVAGYDEQIAAFNSSGLELGDVEPLKAKYQPLIDALYQLAEKVKNGANDGDYAKLLAMLDAIDHGRWDEVTAVQPEWSGWWDSLWSSDSSERGKAGAVVESLSPYRSIKGVATAAGGGALGGTAKTPATEPSPVKESPVPENHDSRSTDVVEDDFWKEVGPAPVIGEGDEKDFAPSFQKWVDGFNSMVKACWSKRSTDHAGTPSENLYDTYKLTPGKVEQLWAVARTNNVDPRLLLAILVQEGTGSFDTNPGNAAFYDGHGPQPDWDLDLQGAFDSLILAKLRLYSAAVKGGFPGDWVDYVNWYTPIDRLNSKGQAGESGVYAEDIYWANGVRRIYLDVVKNTNPDSSTDPIKDYSEWMEAHPELFQPKYVKGAFRIENGLPSGVRGWPTAAVHPANYDATKFPDAKKGKDGFYHFSAPEYYVWRLVPEE